MTAIAAEAGKGGMLADRSVRWLLAGAAINQLGDQFTLIALPWLVLKLTGDPAAMGLVLAAMSIPRAIFILVGGALTDRFSPKRVLMLTKYVNTGLLGLLTVLVLGGWLRMWMVYPIAICIGLATAFSVPSGTAIVPRTVPAHLLGPVNAIMMAMRQISVMAGPLLAGLLVALFGDGEGGRIEDAKGLGIAFLVDTLSFALSTWTLTKVAEAPPADPAVPPAPVFASIAEGLRYFWSDRSLRWLFLYFGTTTFLIAGPLQVATPVMADEQLGGAAALGMLMAAHGVGALLGMALSGKFPRLRLGTLGVTILCIDMTAGLLLAPVGYATQTWQAMLAMVPLGVLAGFIQVVVYTWVQRRVAPALLGRTLALFMFIFMGVGPISAGITGFVLRQVELSTVFLAAGLTLTLIAAAGALSPAIRGVDDGPARRKS
ncbi:MAG TPA: MFS transporter [Azospirillaceae bacterium]|nr:MFS transporter [Azospirillaceae bacterium]